MRRSHFRRQQLNYRHYTSALLIVCAIGYNEITELVLGVRPYEPITNVGFTMLFSAYALLTIRITNPVLWLNSIVWGAWCLIGGINCVASDYAPRFLGFYSNLDLQGAFLIYSTFLAAYTLTLVLSEKLIVRASAGTLRPPYGVDRIAANAFLAFPFLYALDFYRSVGYFPIFSGTNITDYMYEMDYGPLYKLNGLLAVSTVYSALLAITAKTRSHATRYWILAAAFAFISVLDGRRVLLIQESIAVLLIYSLSRSNSTILVKRAAFMGTSILGAYVVLLLVRQGGEGSYTDRLDMLSLVGVEFRDFAYTHTYYQPGTIPNYHWGASTIGSMLNSSLLSIVGIDKTELVSLGSAYAWRDSVLSSPFGIRTGLISELWFAYGWSGLLGMAILAHTLATLYSLLTNASSAAARVFYALAIAAMFTLPFGQSTAVFGVISLYFYAFLGYLLLRLTTRRRLPIGTRHD